MWRRNHVRRPRFRPSGYNAELSSIPFTDLPLPTAHTYANARQHARYMTPAGRAAQNEGRGRARIPTTTTASLRPRSHPGGVLPCAWAGLGPPLRSPQKIPMILFLLKEQTSFQPGLWENYGDPELRNWAGRIDLSGAVAEMTYP